MTFLRFLVILGAFALLGPAIARADDARQMADVLRQLGRYGTSDLRVLVQPDAAKLLAAASRRDAARAAPRDPEHTHARGARRVSVAAMVGVSRKRLGKKLDDVRVLVAELAGGSPS